MPSIIGSSPSATTRASAARPGSASATTRAASERRARAMPRSDMTRRIATCLLAFALVLAHEARADDKLRDDRGALVVLATPPQRIVSLLPSLTESVCAIGACARLVGTDRFSNWPASVAALPKLGGFDDVRIEAVVALKPDVVLVPPSARVIDRLEQLGLKVIVLE